MNGNEVSQEAQRARRSWLRRTLDAGVHDGVPIELQRRVAIANLFALIAVAAYLLFGVSFAAAGCEDVGWLALGHALFALLTPWLNARGYTGAARVWFVLNADLSVFTFLLFVGTAAGSESVFMAAVIFPLVLFDAREQRLAVLMTVVLPVLLFVTARAFLDSHAPLSPTAALLAQDYFMVVQLVVAVVLITIVGHYFGVTERVRAVRELAHRRTQRMLDEVLVESEQRYALASKGANDGLWEWSGDTGSLYYSERWKDILGYREDELGDTFDEWFSRVHPDEREEVRREVEDHLTGRTERLRTEHRVLHKDGTYRWVLVRGLAIRKPGGRAQRMAGWMTDITESRLARQRLEQSEERFRQVLLQATDAMVLVDESGHIVEANDKAGDLFDWGDGQLAGRPLRELDPALSDLSGELAQKVATQGSTMYTHVLQRTDGQQLVIEMHVGSVEYGDARYLLLAARDISQRKRLEAQLMLADRMVSVGTLAAGVAHEINNPLTALMLNLELIERQVTEAEPHLAEETRERLSRGLKRAREGGERVGTIVRDLKTFSRDEADARTEVNVRSVIESTLGLAHPELRRYATTTLDHEGHGMVMANQSRLGQVVLNLALNAAHAFGQRPVSENLIVVRVRSYDHEVMLEVQDNGPGMAPEVASRVFDPFFTTKPAGVGTGLGLFICRNIVEAFDGRIEVQSAPGQGATFRVYLPAAPSASQRLSGTTRRVLAGSWAPDAPDASRSPSSPPVGLPPSRILIIDDEPSVARTLEDVLSGHRVEVARDSDEARRILQMGDPFDLVLCDFDLHARSDGSVYMQARQSDPPLARRWVFMAGSMDDSTSELLLEADNDVIEKPVRSEALWDLLREGAA